MAPARMKKVALYLEYIAFILRREAEEADAAINFFKLHKKPGAVRYCELMKRRGQPEPDGVGTGNPGRESVEWHGPPPRLVLIGPPAAND